jgi:hypothetical protein
MKGKVKRGLGDRAVGSPPASPVKKRPNAAKEKLVAASTRGLKAMDTVPQKERVGLFKFLSKETEEEKRAREKRDKEEAEIKAEWRAATELQDVRDRVVTADEKREAAAGRKRKERERKYLADVEAGVRNEDFTLKARKKRKVCYLFNREYQLKSRRLCRLSCGTNPILTTLLSCPARHVRSRPVSKRIIVLTSPAGNKFANRVSAYTRTGKHRSCSSRS